MGAVGRGSARAAARNIIKGQGGVHVPRLGRSLALPRRGTAALGATTTWTNQKLVQVLNIQEPLPGPHRRQLPFHAREFRIMGSVASQSNAGCEYVDYDQTGNP